MSDNHAGWFFAALFVICVWMIWHTVHEIVRRAELSDRIENLELMLTTPESYEPMPEEMDALELPQEWRI